MILFDVRTLYVSLGGVLIALCISMTYYSFTRKTYDGFGLWNAGILMYGIHAFLIGSQSFFPEFISIYISNVIQYYANILILFGFTAFFDKEFNPTFHIVITSMIALILLPYFTFINPSPDSRIVLASFLTSFYFFLTAKRLTDGYSAKRRPKSIVLFFIFGLSSLLLLIRGIFYLLPENTVSSIFSSGFFNEISIIIMNFMVILIVNGFIYLNSQKLEQELTDKKKIIEEEKNKFNSLSDASFEGIIFSRKNIIIEVNNRICEMLGRSPDEFLGKDISNILLIKKINNEDNNLPSMVNRPKELFCLKKDGTKFSALIQAKKFIYDGKEILVSAIRDITAEKLAKKEMEQLSGLLPICANCKKIRDDKGYWNQVESYIESHSKASFSHGMCPALISENLNR